MHFNRLKFQILQMKLQAIDGLFIHSREGLEMLCLSNEWMNLVEATVQEVGRQYLETRIYDENKWLSGSAGGKVGTMNPAYIAKGLMFILCKCNSVLPESEPHVIEKYNHREGTEIILRMEHRYRVNGTMGWRQRTI